MFVELEDVGHRFSGQEPLFSGVSARFEPGDLVALTGPSGSGKSTLLSIVAGWLRPETGSVGVPDGMAMSWVLQSPFGVARRSALDHVVLPILARRVSRREAVPEALSLLEDFDLAAVASRPFAALSGGEGQRLMLARAVARKPDLILVDEPTAQLDPASAASVVGVLRSLAGRRAIVLIATHDERVRDGCARIIDLTCHAVANAPGSRAAVQRP